MTKIDSLISEVEADSLRTSQALKFSYFSNLARFDVQAPLLALLSPFLATLIAQAGPTKPTILVPFTEAPLRFHYFTSGAFSTWLHPQGTLGISPSGSEFDHKRS